MIEPRIAIIIHGDRDSIEAARARGLTQDYPEERLQFLWRDASRLASARRWHRQIEAFKPQVLYLINTAMPGALIAAYWWLVHRLPFVLDTGDVIWEMARRAGTQPRWKLPLLRGIETLSQRLARLVVVRGTRHQAYLRQQGCAHTAVIRDGYVPAPAFPASATADLRHQLGLDEALVVGVMGSLVWSPRLQICYGWDLIQALAQLQDLPVRGLIIGDGNGRSWLQALARQYHVQDRIVFCGRIPYAEVPRYLQLMDVALSTQTNNLPGQVRTTGKLPEYMASERFILASRVGEAALLLPEIMLLDYDGEVDREYPCKLAGRIRQLCHQRELLSARHALPEIARQNCSYEVLSRQFRTVVSALPA